MSEDLISHAQAEHAEHDQSEDAENLRRCKLIESYRRMRTVFFQPLRDGEDKESFVQAHAAAIVSFAQNELLPSIEIPKGPTVPKVKAYSLKIYSAAQSGHSDEVVKLFLALLEDYEKVPQRHVACPWNELIDELHATGIDLIASDVFDPVRKAVENPSFERPHEFIGIALQRCLDQVSILLSYARRSNSPFGEEHRLREALKYHDLLVSDLKNVSTLHDHLAEWDQLEAYGYIQRVSKLLRRYNTGKVPWASVWMHLRDKLKAPKMGFDALSEEIVANARRLSGQSPAVPCPPEISPRAVLIGQAMRKESGNENSAEKPTTSDTDLWARANGINAEIADPSRAHLLPFRPIAYRNSQVDDEVFIAANFAIAFVSSAAILKSDLNWAEMEPADRQDVVAIISQSARFISNKALLFQQALEPVSHALTAIRKNGPFHCGGMTAENAHQLAYCVETVS